MASRKANPAVIGAFVLSAIALAVAAALAFGSGRLFEQTTHWVIYFDSSVTGLDVGAPVIFRGVTVGSVMEVTAYVDPDHDIVATPVFIELIEGAVRIPAGKQFDQVRVIEAWVKNEGFRAQLKTQSLVTGKLYVDLGFHPETPLEFKGLDPGVPEIPAVPTQLEEIEETLGSAMKRISELPIEEIFARLDSALASADELLGDPKLESAIANLDGTLAEAKKTVRGAGQTLADFDALIEPGSPLYYQLLETLDELSQTARSIRALSDAISRDPDQLIFGRGRPGDQE